MALDLTQIRSFLEVAERGTVAAAAARLGYTPPAVSQHLAKLERQLNVSLFERVGGHLVLAEAGRALVPIARDLLDVAELVPTAVHQSPGRPRLVVAGFASALGAVVTPRLDALNAMASVHLVEADDEPALRELRLGHADIAIVQRYPADPTDGDPRFRYLDVVNDELRLVLPPTFGPATRLTDLAELPWLVNGTGTRCEAATRQLLQDAGLRPTITADIADNQLLLDLVAAGHGATIVPDLVLAPRRPDVTISRHSLGAARTIVAVTRKSGAAVAQAAVGVLATGFPGAGPGRRNRSRTRE